MQEETTHKTIALSVKTTKMTAHILQIAIKKYLDQVQRKKMNRSSRPKIYRGKQPMKKLMAQNAGLSNIEITEKNIKSFERVARKYGVDFSLKKDSTQSPPKYLVFFKSRDVDVINQAFKDYANKQVKFKDKPSIKKQLAALKAQLKNVATNDKDKNKKREVSR
ncbi:PcfB family protein [Enterococcus plantarum]|uniref:PcfB family protein n=1 Tax=Enterococcus plantarum TaxID=1077675 RepID=UPI001A906656|nr:PcfB family protein [Enterococcus plantarum]MBO0468565.1 PcfB family protein [Enterococcus plantarum]